MGGQATHVKCPWCIKQVRRGGVKDHAMAKHGIVLNAKEVQAYLDNGITPNKKPNNSTNRQSGELGSCFVCGQPVPPALAEIGMCGPCTTGEADTLPGGSDDAFDW